MKFYFAVIDSDGSLIVKLCGTYNSIAPIFSSNNFLTVVFKTDSSNNATGFKASWTSVDIEGSIIKSQHYPLFYPLDVDQVKGRILAQAKSIVTAESNLFLTDYICFV